MGARTSRFTGLATGSGKATAVVVCAVMLLAGCGGSGGSATEAGAPVIRGDVAGDSGSTLTAPGTPPAPTIVAGDDKITVTVSPETSGGTPTSYSVTAVVYDYSVGNKLAGTCTVTGASGSCDVTGLTPGMHQVMARATNAAGTSRWSGYSDYFELTGYRKVIFVDDSSGQWRRYRQNGSSPTALIPNTFVNSGSSFLGWNTDVSGRGEGFAAGAIYPFESNITLYAQWGSASATSSSTVSVPGTPPAPTVVAGTAKVTATVAAGTAGGTPTIYTVTAYTATGAAAGTCTVTGASGSCDVTALTGGNAYTVKATAMNTAGTSGASGASSPVTVVAPSPSASATPTVTATPSASATPSVTTQAATVPGAPGLTSLSRRSKTEVWVTFSAPSSNGGVPVTEYIVTARRNGVDVTQSFPPTAGTVSVGPLTRYAQYTFTVMAVNSVGSSKPSNAANFTVG
jgi:hypothetical protein